MLRVNEIFSSIQGEGANSGRVATFIRLSGCNIRCPFCDTNHSSYREMTVEEILDEVTEDFVVITGGEPFAQPKVNEVYELIKLLQNDYHQIAIETNGTIRIDDSERHGIDWEDVWVTVSPKAGFFNGKVKQRQTWANEVKVIFDGKHEPSCYIDSIVTDYYYLQPCDTGDAKRNQEIIKQMLEYQKKNTSWRISLQLQKILNVR